MRLTRTLERDTWSQDCSRSAYGDYITQSSGKNQNTAATNCGPKISDGSGWFTQNDVLSARSINRPDSKPVDVNADHGNAKHTATPVGIAQTVNTSIAVKVTVWPTIVRSSLRPDARFKPAHLMYVSHRTSVYITPAQHIPRFPTVGSQILILAKAPVCICQVGLIESIITFIKMWQ